MNKLRIVTVVLTVVLLLASVSAVWAVPPLPSSFYGAIHISDGPPTTSDQVLAYVPDVTGAVGTGRILVDGTDLVYTIDVRGEDTDIPGRDGALENDVISFRINGRLVMTGIWHSGTNVNLPIHPPDPVVTNSGPVAEGSAVTIDASGSADWGTDIATYAFDCDNDGTYEIGPQASATAQCTFGDGPSSHTVAVRVVDSQGGVGTDTTTVTVNNVAPTVAISGAASVNEGATYTLNLSATGDPGTDTISGWSINWGDGAPQSITGNPASVTHVYADGPHSYTISATATDEDDTYTTNTVDVTVLNVAPTVAISGAASVNEGATYTLNLSATGDPGTDTISGWSIDWGDGAPQSITGNPASVTHVYADGPHSYTISATATDEDDTYTTNTVDVTVLNVAPTVAISGAASVNEGATYTLNLSATGDPGTDTISGWSINWGDGAPQSITGNPASVTHVYADGPHSYTISATATDEDDTYTTNTVDVTVLNVAPTAEAGGPYNGTAGLPVNLSGSATDPGTLDTFTYEWDLDNDGQYDDATGASPSYTWNTVGDYTIGLRVTDKDGGVGIDTAIVHISGATHAITLVPGWNLVSFNLHPVSVNITDVLASLTTNYDLVYAWDATGGHSTDGNWVKYTANGIPYDDSLSALDETMGFWIHITASSNVTLNVVGSIPTTTSIALYDDVGGWNLVGYPSAANGTLPAILQNNGVGTNFSLVYAYHAENLADPWKLFDRTAPVWSNDLSALAPGRGYWVRVSADPTWTVGY